MGAAAWASAARKTAMVNALCQLPLASHLVCNLIRHVGQRVGLAGKMPAVRRQAGGRGRARAHHTAVHSACNALAEKRWSLDGAASADAVRRPSRTHRHAQGRAAGCGTCHASETRRPVVHPCGMRRAQLAAKSAAAQPSAACSWPPPLPRRQPPPTSGAGAPRA